MVARLVTATLVTAALSLASPRVDDAGLAAALRRIAANAPGTAGVSIVHIESGGSAALNPAARFPMMIGDTRFARAAYDWGISRH